MSPTAADPLRGLPRGLILSVASVFMASAHLMTVAPAATREPPPAAARVHASAAGAGSLVLLLLKQAEPLEIPLARDVAIGETVSQHRFGRLLALERPRAWARQRNGRHGPDS